MRSLSDDRVLTHADIRARLGDKNRYEIDQGTKHDIGDTDDLDGKAMLQWSCSFEDVQAFAHRHGLNVAWRESRSGRSTTDAGFEEAPILDIVEPAITVQRINDLMENA